MMRILIYIAAMLVVFGCSRKNSPKVQTSQPDKPKQEQRDYASEGFQKAVMTDMTGLDGCGYLVKLENETKLVPENLLEEEFQKDGLEVWVKYAINKMGVSTCMAGQVASITDIARR